MAPLQREPTIQQLAVHVALEIGMFDRQPAAVFWHKIAKEKEEEKVYKLMPADKADHVPIVVEKG